MPQKLQNKGLASIFFVEKEEVEPSDHNFPPSGWEGWGENNLQGQGRRRRRRRKMKRIIIDRKDRRRVRHNELERPTTKTGNQGSYRVVF